MPVVRTADVGIDQAGNVEVYVPPNVTVITPGSEVSYGPPQNLADEANLPTGTGIWLVSSGQLVASGPVTVVPVTITTP